MAGLSVGVSALALRRCLRLRRYVVPSHSTRYDLGATSYLQTPGLQVVLPGNLRYTESPLFSGTSVFAILL